MSVVVSADAVSAALSKMQTMLEADGYALDVAMEDGAVALTVRATPEACAECLVPKSLFATMAADLLGKGGVPVDADDLVVTYPTEH